MQVNSYVYRMRISTALFSRRCCATLCFRFRQLFARIVGDIECNRDRLFLRHFCIRGPTGSNRCVLFVRTLATFRCGVKPLFSSTKRIGDFGRLFLRLALLLCQ